MLTRNVSVGSVRKSVYKSYKYVLGASLSSLTRTVRICLSYKANTLPRSPSNSSGICYTLGRAFLSPVDVSLCPMSSAIVSQELPQRNLRTCGRRDYASALGAADNRSAPNAPDIINIIVC